MIINLSNHPKETWQEKQLQAARAYGELVDLPFPQLPGSMTGEREPPCRSFPAWPI